MRRSVDGADCGRWAGRTALTGRDESIMLLGAFAASEAPAPAATQTPRSGELRISLLEAFAASEITGRLCVGGHAVASGFRRPPYA